MNPLVIRTDASSEIGLGHVMRCLALAHAWQDWGGKVIFVMHAGDGFRVERLATENVATKYFEAELGSDRDAHFVTRIAQENGADWIVVDGYKFDDDYVRTIQKSKVKVLRIDDGGACAGDLILNQNVCARAEDYRGCASTTGSLLGTRFALLRREFLQSKELPSVIGENPKKLLVTFGGSDPANATNLVLQALDLLKDRELHVTVLAGPANPRFEEIKQRAASSHHTVEVIQSTTRMPELLASTDLAISASGSTSWELSFFGVPSILMAVAENQEPIAQELGRLGAAISLGRLGNVTAPQIASVVTELLDSVTGRHALRETAMALVDGHGAARVSMHLTGDQLWLRPARRADAKTLWTWANDPGTRAASFSNAFIPWEVHCRWFEQKLADRDCLLRLAFDRDDQPIGQIRLDLAPEHEATVNVSVAPERRGQGWGKELIRLAIAELETRDDQAFFIAYIKPENRASQSAFAANGFVLEDAANRRPDRLRFTRRQMPSSLN